MRSIEGGRNPGREMPGTRAAAHAPEAAGSFIASGVVVAVVIACMLACVGMRHYTLNLLYSRSAADRTFWDLRKENNELKLEAGMNRSPHRIEGIAKLELGLTSPVPEQIIVLKTGKTAWRDAKSSVQAKLR